MAKFYLIFSLLAIFGLSFLIKSDKGVYPVIFNFCILPLGILAYMEGLWLGLAGAGVCLLIFLWHVFFLSVEPVSVFPAIAVFCITPLALTALRKVSGERRAFFSKELENSEKIVDGLKARSIKLNTGLKELDEKISEIAGLYEMTKNMSSSLLFDEIFRIFREFLKKNFKFKICRLSLLNKDEKISGNVYEIKDMPGPGYGTARLEIPLKSQNRVIGMLNVEGLDDGALEKFLIVSKQFSLEIEKARLYEAVQELAITDGVTGIFVRRYFLEMLKEEFERSLKHKFKLSFLMVDLDYFKECNDRFGHLIGDIILKEISKVLRYNIREVDLIGRYGGEEFSLLLPETDKTNAKLVAERLREGVANQDFRAYDEVIRMTISAGISTFPDDAKTIPELIEFADKALYEAKARGRNKVVAFERR